MLAIKKGVSEPVLSSQQNLTEYPSSELVYLAGIFPEIA
jgi:hypothetical protein